MGREGSRGGRASSGPLDWQECGRELVYGSTDVEKAALMTLSFGVSASVLGLFFGDDLSHDDLFLHRQNIGCYPCDVFVQPPIILIDLSPLGLQRH